MEKVITAVALIMFSATVALAGDTMTFQTKMGEVTFPHKKHQEMLKGCTVCHLKGPGKIEGFGKEFAHKTCKGCHADSDAGPIKCSECHKK